MPASTYSQNNADPYATKEIVPDSNAIITSHSGHSIDSLFKSLNSDTSKESYGENRDQFNTNANEVFRAKNDKDGRYDSSNLGGDDLSLSVATSADFSFATQNTNRDHYPVQYKKQPLNKDLLDDEPTESRTEDNVVSRDTDETEGQVEQIERNSQGITSKKKKIYNNNKAKRVSNQLFCDVASGAGIAFNAALSSVNSCFVPTDSDDNNGTRNGLPEMRDYFSSCYRPELDSTNEGDERDVYARDNNVN